MAKDHAGDWRDAAQVTAWAHHLAGVPMGASPTRQDAM
jgi:hypothetical protein